MKEKEWQEENLIKKYNLKEDIKSNIKNSEKDQILKFANLISDSDYSLYGKGIPNPLVHKTPKGVS